MKLSRTLLAIVTAVLGTFALVGTAHGPSTAGWAGPAGSASICRSRRLAYTRNCRHPGRNH